ncbi:MAG: cell division protein FtsW [Elusimicrobia bacterium RIFOXYA2_FULL_39_19]|nr:MAG: cell division protein FtsW [Elusimicrobia bacterium RIFOXYA2_FULL_39_19]
MLSKINEADNKLIIITFLLVCFGIVMIYSSSAIVTGERRADQFFFLKKQIMWTLISFVFFMFFLMMDYRVLQKVSVPLIIISAIFLIAVLLMGKSIKGAKRWLDFGPISFQPSEFSKLAVIIFVADFIDKNRSKLKDFFQGFLVPIAVAGLICALIAIEPDIGIPFIIISITMILLFIGGAKITHLLIMISAAIPVFYLAVLSKPYRVTRFFAFLDPWKFSQSSAYQLCQSLMSIGSGGIFGKGLGNSDIKKFYLPEAHTDFIFSIISEELGLIGAAGVIFLFAWFLQRGIKIANNAQDYFGTLLAAGLTLSIVMQALFNIAVCSGCLPTKGIALPFFSYGGTSLVLTLSAVGILANISRNRSKPVKFR